MAQGTRNEVDVVIAATCPVSDGDRDELSPVRGLRERSLEWLT